MERMKILYPLLSIRNSFTLILLAMYEYVSTEYFALNVKNVYVFG